MLNPLPSYVSQLLFLSTRIIVVLIADPESYGYLQSSVFPQHRLFALRWIT